MNNTTLNNTNTFKSLNNSVIIAKADSGASANYWRPQDIACMHNIRENTGHTVLLPNGKNITSTKEGYLNISPKLNNNTRKATVLPDLQSASLLSLGTLCDDECEVLLNKTSMTVNKAGKCILKGYRNTKDGLWDVPISTQHPNPKVSIQENYILPKIHCIRKKLQQPITQPYKPSKSPRRKLNTPTFLQHLALIAEDTALDQTIEEFKQTDINSKINIIIKKKQPKATLAQYLHATCFSPVPSTFIKAIQNNNFITWPGLTTKLIQRHLPPSIATEKGHIRQEYSGLQSTKTPAQAPIAMAAAINETKTTDKTKKTRDTIAIILEYEPTKGYIDLTGRFPYRSAQGNQYIFVTYHVDSDAILVKAIKNREAGEITKAWKSINERLRNANEVPNLYIIDNEASKQLKDAMQNENIKYQLVPPHNHRANRAERAIQTFKYHLKAGLATVDPDFPVAQWDRLLDQAEITLNLLRNANCNPKLSSYAYLFGPFDFNKTPMAPPGTKVVAHSKKGQRDTWGPNGEVGFYVAPSLEHYRCMKVYFPSTRTVRDVDTLTFIPHCITFPQLKIDDYLRNAAADIAYLLKKPPSNMIPSLQAGKTTNIALENLATLLNRVELKPTIPTTKGNKDNMQETRVKLLKNPKSPITTSTITRNPFTNTKHAHRTHTPQTRYNLRDRNIPNGGYAHQLSTLNHIYDTKGRKMKILDLLQGDDRVRWNKSMSNELGRLAQGNIHGVKYSDTMRFIHKDKVPPNKKVTYANFRADYRPLKPEPYRIRCVVGGDKLEYESDTASPTTDLLETKLLINSTISDARKGARFCSVDLRDFFLSSTMKEPEYMKLHLKYIPQDIIEKYNLLELAVDGYVYIMIRKGMYGLKQAAILANQQLQQNLAKEGYYPIQGTSGLWKHRTLQTKIVLCIDDFGIKYFRKQDLEHFLHSISKYYDYHIDKTGTNYIGLTLEWDYARGMVEISMPGYINRLLQRIKHEPSTSPQHSPHEHLPFIMGGKGTRQYAQSEDGSPKLDARQTKYVQSVVGALLYYARAIDASILPALSSISTQQANPTEQVLKKVKRLLDYVSTYPDAKLRYYASNMILYIDSDAAYLCERKAKSRASGYHYFKKNTLNKIQQPINHALTVECKLLKHVVSSAAEAEVSALFLNAQTGIIIRRLLQHLGHPQPPTPLKTDNTTAERFVSKNIQQKKSKTWDMRFYWLRNQESRQNFQVYWKHGADAADPNHADYFTKHHTVGHHRSVRPRYIFYQNREEN